MAENITIELRCSKTPDGKYNARTFFNGKEQKGKEFIVNRSTDFAVLQLYQRLKKDHPGIEPHVKGLDSLGMQKILQTKE